MVKKVPQPVDAFVRARVRARRLELGMSQEKLGDAIGLTFQQVHKYEKGSNRIGSSRIMQIAAALDVQPSYFFEKAPGNSKFKEKNILRNTYPSTTTRTEWCSRRVPPHSNRSETV